MRIRIHNPAFFTKVLLKSTIVLFWLHGRIWSTLSSSIGDPDPHQSEKPDPKERAEDGAIEAHPRVMDAHNRVSKQWFCFC
jgi:hypothetical protein